MTAAIAGALTAGAMSGLTGTAITDGYTKLKDLLAHRFGDKSEVGQAVERLEGKPALPVL